jgi:hypothetical protein
LGFDLKLIIMNSKLGHFYAAVVVANVLCGASFAQERAYPVIESRGGATCESVSAELDSFLQHAKPSKGLIAVSFQGKLENRPGVGLQRLRMVAKHVRRLPVQGGIATIFAVADDKSERGRVDFFLDGEIAFQIVFTRDSYLALSPCVASSTRNRQETGVRSANLR